MQQSLLSESPSTTERSLRGIDSKKSIGLGDAKVASQKHLES